MSLRSRLLLPMLGLLALSGCDTVSLLFGFPTPTITTSTSGPVELAYREGPGGLMLLKGQVTSARGTTGEVEFILDTGAPVTVLFDGPATTALKFDTSNARKLGPADNPAVPIGIIEPGFTIQLGGVALSGVTTVVIPSRTLPCQERFAAISFQGVIGADLFRAFVVEVDSRNKRIRLHPPAQFRPGDLQPLALTFASGHPHIDAQVRLANGATEQIRMVVDTGYNQAAWFHTGAHPGLTPRPGAKSRKSCYVDGEVESQVGEPLTVMLGSLPARVAEPSLAPHRKVHDASVQGSVGVALLAPFRYAIDYPGKRLWVGARLDTAS